MNATPVKVELGPRRCIVCDATESTESCRSTRTGEEVIVEVWYEARARRNNDLLGHICADCHDEGFGS